MNNLMDMLRRLGIQRKYILLLIFRAPFDGCRAWMLAGLMKTTFSCIAEENSDKLMWQCLFYGLICGVLFFYNGAVWSIYAAFAAKTEAMLQRILFQRMLGRSLSEIEENNSEWITRLNSDIHGAFLLMNGPLNIPHSVVAIVNLTLSTLLLCRSSLHIFLLTWIFLLPHMILNAKLILRDMPRLKEEAQEQLAENTAAIVPLITVADTIWVYHAEALMMQSCEGSSRRLMATNMKLHMRKALGDAILYLLGLAGYLVILFVGGGSILGGDMEFSDLSYAFQIRGALLSAMLMLTNCIGNIKINSVCVKRIRDIW